MRRGQVSVEYLIVLGFTLLILIPSIYLFSSFAESSGASLTAAQSARLGNEMLATALEALAQGEGSWLTLDVNVPEAVTGINIASSGKEVTITHKSVYGDSVVILFSDVGLANTSDPTAPSDPVAYPTWPDGSVFGSMPHSGSTKLRFTAIPGGKVAVSEVTA